ncbi:MAG: prenyltransferase/squalene oxidase repeat-containing protein [Bacteroidota bacterium]
MTTVLFSVFLLSVSCLYTACQAPAPPPPLAEDLLRRSCAWLWDQQGEDGGWHSETHGILKGGESFTAFILWHLLCVDKTVFPRDEQKVQKGLQFLRAHLSEEGVLGVSDPMIVDYPNYATAHALRTLSRYGTQTDRLLIQQMADYLLSQQFTEQRGISPEQLAYGAWGFGETHLSEGATGHVDLSHTRRILESLRWAGRLDSASLRKVGSFLQVVQKHPKGQKPQPGHHSLDSLTYDGGFYASAVTTSTNKSRLDSLQLYPSYATATADGLLALLAAGRAVESEEVQAAHCWLQAHPILYRPEGIPTDDPYRWHEVMFFYHLSVRAEALAAVGDEGEWREKMSKLLQEVQRSDGSYLNPVGSLNKEDDPLLATALGIIALRSCLPSPDLYSCR